MSDEHRRPLLAFVVVFVVAMVVLVSAARSDAFRDLVRERTVDIVAATTLDLVGEPEPRLVVATTPGDPSGEPAEVSSAPGQGKASTPAHTEPAGKDRGHDEAKPPGKAKGHDKAGHPGKATGHDKAGHPGKGKRGR